MTKLASVGLGGCTKVIAVTSLSYWPRPDSVRKSEAVAVRLCAFPVGQKLVAAPVFLVIIEILRGELDVM